jgi:hypothetical protein
VRSNLIPINSEKFHTEFNGPQCIGVKIQIFQLTLNDPTSITKNIISLELGLYYSNHCRNIVERTTDVLYVLH